MASSQSVQTLKNSRQRAGREGRCQEGGREAQNQEGGAHLRFVVKGDGYMRKEEHALKAISLYGWGCKLCFEQSDISFPRFPKATTVLLLLLQLQITGHLATPFRKFQLHIQAGLWFSKNLNTELNTNKLLHAKRAWFNLRVKKCDAMKLELKQLVDPLIS